MKYTNGKSLNLTNMNDIYRDTRWVQPHTRVGRKSDSPLLNLSLSPLTSLLSHLVYSSAPLQYHTISTFPPRYIACLSLPSLSLPSSAYRSCLKDERRAERRETRKERESPHWTPPRGSERSRGGVEGRGGWRGEWVGRARGIHTTRCSAVANVASTL